MDETIPAIEEDQRLELSPRDSEAFVEALLNPPPANARLRETVRRYRQVMGGVSGRGSTIPAAKAVKC